MIELIGNCKHHTPIQTAFLTDTHNRPVSILKTSFSSDGREILEREHRGLSWYVGQLHVNPVNAGIFHRQTHSYARFEFPYHPGEVGQGHHPISQNYARLSSAIAHWQKLFGDRACRFNHGDYALGNIVFHSDTVAWVLDWEGFTDELPRGFDLMNLIMEACILRYTYHGWNRLSRDDVRLLIQLMHRIADSIPLPDGFLQRPASGVTEIYRSHKAVFGMQWEKYPFALIDRKVIDDIDRHFTGAQE
ncbi:MAG: hypothetical protein LUP92_02565 [Methanomicrobiales archaeon]|nr:hypothetical protein [Methanomicrobiales archaeon]